MARPARGKEFLAQAKEMLKNAKTIEEFRQAQVFILPLEYGFSIKQVEAVTGISRGWACQLRTRFIQNGGRTDDAVPKRGGRRRENLKRRKRDLYFLHIHICLLYTAISNN